MSASLLNRSDLPLILCRVVGEKLNASGALSLVRRAKFGNNPLQLSSDNSLLLEFQGLVPASKFRMLVSFLPVNLLALETHALISRSRDLLWFDLAVFWTTQEFSTLESQSLKGIGIHVLTALPPTKVGAPYQQITDFIHIPTLPYDQVLEVNLLANEIVKRLRKKFHLVLSELAANSYDDYGTFATREVMSFEDNLLKEVLQGLLVANKGGLALAIDVGCGNGRHTRVLAKYFSEVVAFDLSRKMIDAAREKDHRVRVDLESLVTYYECDVEYEEFPDERSLAGKADFVCASFGMPSFVEDTAALLRRFYRWLRAEGKVLLTFYNSRSVSLSIDAPWKERALSAAIDITRSALDVELRDGVRFSIYCKPFDEKVMEMVKAYFVVERVLTFPHILALLPPSICGTDEEPNHTARSIFPLIDRAVAANSDLGWGHYVFVIARKGGVPHEGYLRVLSALQILNLEYQIIEHQAVVSTRDVSELLSLDPSSMVKTVIFKSLRDDRFFVVLVSPTQHVDTAKLAVATGLEKKELVLAPPTDVEHEFGFPIGGVPPLGYGESDRVMIFVDPALRLSSEAFMFMGVGDNTKTLKLPKQSFLRLTENYQETSLALESDR